MGNTSRPKGLKPQNAGTARCRKYFITAAQVLSDGDVVSLDSAGTLVIGAGLPVGVVNGGMIDGTTGGIKATAEAGDYCFVWDDPATVFIAQITSFAATDPYTTRSSAACYDIAGATGVQYIDAGSHAQDAMKIIGLEYEENGVKSVVGAYAKVECRFNLLKHVYGVIA